MCTALGRKSSVPTVLAAVVTSGSPLTITRHDALLAFVALPIVWYNGKKWHSHVHICA